MRRLAPARASLAESADCPRGVPATSRRPGTRGALIAVGILLAMSTVPAPSAAQGAGGSQAVVLLHHPYDCVDPFGVPYGDGADAGCSQSGPRPGDTFSARRGAIAQNGRFDFPTFLADGVLPISALPDPTVPYASTLANYTARVVSRLALGSPGTLLLQGDLVGDALVVTSRFEPVAPLADPQHPDSLHLMVAVAEDFIHYQPDARVSNGVTEHRFTVRALRDTGSLDLAQGQEANRTASFAIPATWMRANLLVAAWVEASAPFGRFGAGEVLQAAWAHADGTQVVQRGKAVLVELYSATWCNPCLFGDKAAEELAVQFGGAAKLAAAQGPKYFRGPDQPVVVVAAVAAAGVAAGWWTLRPRRGGVA